MKINSDFVLRDLEGENIIIPRERAASEFNGLITVNGVELKLWQMLQKEITFEELVQGILDEYDVEEDTAREDIGEFLDKLISGGVLTVDEEVADAE